MVHPFTPVGKNSELLLVCDKKDLESWQKQNLPLSVVTRLKETSRTEMNHIRYVGNVNRRNPKQTIFWLISVTVLFRSKNRSNELFCFIFMVLLGSI